MIRSSDRVSVFQESRLPEPASLAGYAALIDAYELRVPLAASLLSDVEAVSAVNELNFSVVGNLSIGISC